MKLKFLTKLSLLDYFVIFAILFGVLFSLRFLTREQRSIYLHTETESREWAGEQIPNFYWLSNFINVGDPVYTPSGTQIGEVLYVYNVDWGANRRYSRYKLQVNAIFDKRTNEYRVSDVPMTIGRKIDLIIGNTAYKGTITYVGETIDPPNYIEKYVRARIKVSKVEPWLADTYNGSFEVKNTDGRVVFKVEEAKVVPFETSEVDSRGRRIRTLDPLFKDVYLTALIYVACQEDICYFNGSFPIKVGAQITVQSPKSMIQRFATDRAGWIIDVEELPQDFSPEEPE